MYYNNTEKAVNNFTYLCRVVTFDVANSLGGVCPLTLKAH